MVTDDTAVGRNVDLTVGEGVESIKGLVARHARHQVDLYLHLCRGEVVDALGLDLPFLNGFGDALYEGADGLGVG